MGRRWKEFTINVKRALVGFSALLLSAIAAPAGAVNLLTNGSFEQTSLSTSGFVTNSDLTGWMTTSGYTFEVFPGMETTTGIGSGVKLYPGAQRQRAGGHPVGLLHPCQCALALRLA